MDSRRVGAAVAIGAVVVAVVLFIVLSSGDDSNTSSSGGTTTTEQTGGNQPGGGGGGGKPSAPKAATIVVRNGEAVGGVQDLSFTQGDDIRFDVKSDAAWEIHFHGYDVAMDVKAGGSVSFDVPADIEGVFEVEIEQTATQIAQITVNPG